MGLVAVILLTLLLGGPLAGQAVLIDSGTGTENASAPPDDPGWDNVGTRGTLSAVYVGNSYVLTAGHTGVGDVVLGGVTHQAVPGTEVTILNADLSFADLRLFSIHPVPNLPALPIATTQPAVGAEVVLIGHGRDRGAATSFDSNGPLPPEPVGGYLWLATQSMRWGTNEVNSFTTVSLAGTTSSAFSTLFDEVGTLHEATATSGDSGGAAFLDTGSQWELAGIIFAISQFPGQPPSSSIYGNPTLIVDLSVYRTQIVDTIALPEPSGGLLAGTLLLHALARARATRGGRGPA